MACPDWLPGSMGKDSPKRHSELTDDTSGLSRCLEILKLEVGIGERIHLGVRYNTNTLTTGQHRSIIGWLVWFVLDFIFYFLCFNATFSNISAISWRPVLVVEKAGVSGENHRP